MSGSELLIFIHTPKEAVVDVCVRLCRRMFQGLHRVTFQRLSGRQYEHLPTISRSEDLPNELAAVLESDDVFRLIGMTTTASGRKLRMEISCFGQGYGGDRIGYLQTEVDWSDIVLPNWWKKEQMYPPAVGTCRTLPAQLLTDVEALFFRVVGLCNPAHYDPQISSAALQWDTRWWGPDGYSMTYHKDPCDVVRDIAFIYGHYYWGLAVPQMRYLNRDIWTLSEQERLTLKPPFDPAPCNEDRSFWFQERNYEDMIKVNAIDHAFEHWQFLNGLDVDTALRVSTLACSVSKDLLIHALDQLTHIRGYDLGDHGFVLSADPPASLWQVYASIIEQASTLAS